MKLSEALQHAGTVSDEIVADVAALERDAERYRKTRTVACETDEKVLDTLEHFIHTQDDTMPDPITPEAWDAHVDAVHAMHERLTRAK
ncbi:gp34 [Burkholderia phage BcepB1A]|uniref:gp34 n=1 Tax=Burkholderia phage BcepB1A TaxID=279530 RepID=UPI000037799C|nr:gp34 [Burkholderia phage BcepB1A]AAT37737.1 gp34 [Burkholderia phage BcepB1A]